MKEITIGNKKIGSKHPVFVVAEIGINHNGDISTAKNLIDVAKESGCDAVKFQKRTIDLVYTKEELAKPRESIFGTTNGDLKRGLEFGWEVYKMIDMYCKEKDILWFASCWDTKSIEFMDQFDVPCHKIASPMLTNDAFLKCVKKRKKPIILSTGMSTIEQIDHAVDILGTDDLIILHCTSTYPAKLEELNLKCIQTLQKRYPECPIGYSGHEVGVYSTLAAGALGACMIERHITLNRSMFGTDQPSSLEPKGLKLIIENLKEIPIILGDGVKKVYDSEKPIIQKLRK